MPYFQENTEQKKMRRSKWEIIGDMNTMKWWQVLLLIVPLLIIFPILYFLDLACICVFGVCGLYLLIIMTVFTVLKIIASKKLKQPRGGQGYSGFEEEFRDPATGDTTIHPPRTFDEGVGTGPGYGEFSGHLEGRDKMYKKGLFRKPRYFRECLCHPDNKGIPPPSASDHLKTAKKSGKKKRTKEKKKEPPPLTSTSDTIEPSSSTESAKGSKKEKKSSKKKEKKKKEKTKTKKKSKNLK